MNPYVQRQDDYTSYLAKGLDSQTIIQAMNTSVNRSDYLQKLDNLLIMRPTTADINMAKAIEASLKDQQRPQNYDNKKISEYNIEDFESPEERIRKDNMPVGLKNVGNSILYG